MQERKKEEEWVSEAEKIKWYEASEYFVVT